jgi:hypothetical protein
LVVLLGIEQAGAEPVQWSGNGHWYEAVYVEGGISWTDASDAATAAGGYLATVTSLPEDGFVFGLSVSDPRLWFNHTDYTIGPWLGGYQPPGSPEPAGGWSWVTGEPFDYTNWASDQPNDTSGGQDSLIYYGVGNDNPQFLWNDTWGDFLVNGYIVEIIPEPSSLLMLVTGAIGLGLCGRRWRKR